MNINNYVKAKKLRDLHEDKSPTKDINYVGVEIECFLNYENLATLKDLVIDKGLDEYCIFKSDSSITYPEEDMCDNCNEESCDDCREEDLNYTDLELCILVPEKEYKKVITKICKLLNKVNAQVNRSCGLHVHLDMRFRDVNLSFYNLTKTQDLLFEMVPRSRKNNRFCKKIQTFKNIEEASAQYSESRYLGINPQAFYSHKTLECRIHSGTVEAEKIINWINLLIKIANYNKPLPELKNNIHFYKKTFKFPKVLADYIKIRIKKFVPESEFLKAA